MFNWPKLSREDVISAKQFGTITYILTPAKSNFTIMAQIYFKFLDNLTTKFVIKN